MLEEEIDELRLSKAWSSRYGQYLRKVFLEEDEIKRRLVAWIAKWKGRKDSNGRFIVSSDTESAVERQIPNIRFVVDEIADLVYTEIPGSRKARCDLPKWQSNRPESALEKFHESIAHYANSGMREEYADTLTLRGIARHNVGRRFRFKVSEQRLGGDTPLHPAWMDTTPAFYNHLELSLLNSEVASRGFEPPFRNVDRLVDDNGEQFLSKYLHSLESRSQEEVPQPVIATAPVGTPGEVIRGVSEPVDPSSLSNHRRNVGPGTGDVLPRAPTTTVPVARPTMPYRVQPMPPPNYAMPNWYTGGVSLPNFHVGRCFVDLRTGHQTVCRAYGDYLAQQRTGIKKRGRPPHSWPCPKSFGGGRAVGGAGAP